MFAPRETRANDQIVVLFSMLCSSSAVTEDTGYNEARITH